MRRLIQLTVVGLLIAALWPFLRELLGRASGTPDAGQGWAGQPGSAPPSGAGASEGDGVSSMSRADLYKRAQELDIPGRSKMSKDELAAAIAAARGAAG